MSTKPRILVVGGMTSRNIPTWAAKAFDIEHFEQDNQRLHSPAPDQPPAAVVVLKWVTHKHYFDARAVAERYDVPLLLSAGGWSEALQRAMEEGLEWFVTAVERAKSGAAPEEQEQIQETVDNAWRQAYERELSARLALEKRYRKERAKFESAQSRLQSAETRQAAAERVITEIREAASQQRVASGRQKEHLEAVIAEVRNTADALRLRDNNLIDRLRVHFDYLRELLNLVDMTKDQLLTSAQVLTEAQHYIMSTASDLKATIDEAAQDIAPLGLTQSPSQTGSSPLESDHLVVGNDSSSRPSDLSARHG